MLDKIHFADWFLFLSLIVSLSQAYRINIKFQLSTKNQSSMTKKEIWKTVLTVVKYAITLVIGYLGGDSNLLGL